MKLHVTDYQQMLEDLKASRDQLLLLANQMGACALNGRPAVLIPPASERPLWKIRTQDGTDGATFSESVVRYVVLEQGERFRTRELRPFACC